MRCLMVLHAAGRGGSTAVAISLARHRPADVEVVPVVLQDGPAIGDLARACGAAPVVLDAGRARDPRGAIAVVRELARRAATVDVVLAHVSKAQLYCGPAARRAAGRPASVWWQHERLRDARLMQSLATALPCDLVICASEHLAAGQRARWPRRPVEVVHPGAEGLGELPLRRHESGAGEPHTLGIVGRIDRWKRVDLAIRALAAIRVEEPQARLRVIGAPDGAEGERHLAELRALAAALGVDAAVEFTGHVRDARRAIAELDVLLHAADDEPFGLVLVEALASGVPVVAPPGAGPAEIIRDGEDGLLALPQDTSAYARSVVSLLRDPQRRNAVGAAGAARARSRFTAERSAQAAWPLLRALSGSRPS